MKKFYIYLFILIICIILITVILYYINEKKINNTYIKSKNTPYSLSCPINQKEAQEGLDYLKDKKVIITGLIRNSRDTISTIKSNVKKLSNIFKDYSVLIVENDSTDNTRKELLKWSKIDNKVKILGCGINAPKCSLSLPPTLRKTTDDKRIKKMVLLRNIYLDYIKDNKQDYKDYDYVIVMDFDIKGTFYNDGMGTTGLYFKENPEIDGICANGFHIYNLGLIQLSFYHDPYAHKDLYGKERGMNVDKCEKENFKEVLSCFNGFTIYKLKSLLDKKYELHEDELYNQTECEHVSLNKKLNNMYINPYLLFIIISNK